ncbi:MAG: hypothetical protein WBL93_10610 [Lutisporaceae bacterium]
MKPIIVFYSYTGKTGLITKSMAEELQCEVKEIKEKKKRSILGAYFMGGLAAMRGKESDIEPLNVDFTDKDLIIIATPVWASSPVPAINSFISKIDFKDKNVVLLFSAAGGDDKKASVMLTDRINKKGGRVLTHHGFKTSGTSEEALIAQAQDIARLYK